MPRHLLVVYVRGPKSRSLNNELRRGNSSEKVAWDVDFEEVEAAEELLSQILRLSPRILKFVQSISLYVFKIISSIRFSSKTCKKTDIVEAVGVKLKESLDPATLVELEYVQKNKCSCK